VVAKRRQIDLLLPGLFWGTAIEQLNERHYQPKQLERVLSRANPRQFPAADLTETLFRLFGIAAKQGRDLPAGAITSLGMNNEPGDACLALATPVHLLADRDRLILIRLSAQAIQREYAQRLIERFNTHFKHDGISLTQASPGQWCLWLSEVPEMTTSNIESVVGRHVEEYLPVGNDALYWRKVLNETQMLFFQDEVNQTKMVSGEPHINGLWLSGIGVCPQVETDYEVVYGQHLLLAGLAKLAHIPNYELPGDMTDITQHGGKTAILITDMLEAELNGDIQSWQTALVSVDSRLAQLLEAIDPGQVQLSIYTCRGHSYDSWKSWPVLGFFSRNRTLNRLLKDCSASRSTSK
jgi:hypothetical protein